MCFVVACFKGQLNHIETMKRGKMELVQMDSKTTIIEITVVLMNECDNSYKGER